MEISLNALYLEFLSHAMGYGHVFVSFFQLFCFGHHRDCLSSSSSSSSFSLMSMFSSSSFCMIMDSVVFSFSSFLWRQRRWLLAPAHLHSSWSHLTSFRRPCQMWTIRSSWIRQLFDWAQMVVPAPVSSYAGTKSVGLASSEDTLVAHDPDWRSHNDCFLSEIVNGKKIHFCDLRFEDGNSQCTFLRLIWCRRFHWQVPFRGHIYERETVSLCPLRPVLVRPDSLPPEWYIVWSPELFPFESISVFDHECWFDSILLQQNWEICMELVSNVKCICNECLLTTNAAWQNVASINIWYGVRKPKLFL